MDRVGPADGKAPEAYREFLAQQARLRIDPRLRSKIDAEDLVQETLLETHVAGSVFSTLGERQQKAWLRQALLNNLNNQLRRFLQAMRDINREQPIGAIAESSSARLEAVLAADQSTPSERAQRNEMALRLEEALEQLPERQRQAVVLKHYHSWTLAQISEYMEATQLAVAGLLHRGMMQLRDLLPGQE